MSNSVTMRAGQLPEKCDPAFRLVVAWLAFVGHSLCRRQPIST
jgi:hypothetical protein